MGILAPYSAVFLSLNATQRSLVANVPWTNAHSPLVWGRCMDNAPTTALRVPPPLSGHYGDPDDDRWTVHSVIAQGWRELVTFEASGVVIFGDFVVSNTASINICTQDLFFLQIMLEGHDVFMSTPTGREVGDSRIILGRFYGHEDTCFALPQGGRWRSLFVALSEGAVAHMWGMTHAELMAAISRSLPVHKASGVELVAHGNYLKPSEITKLRQIFNCNLTLSMRKAFLWSKSLELMIDIVSGLLEQHALPAVASPSAKAVREAREIMHRELSHPHTIDSLCFRVGLNRRDFIVSFRSHFGLTFHEYYTRLRMSEAAVLLRNGNHTVSDVARSVGYAQLSSFSRAFKSFHGFSPCQLIEDYH